MVSDFKLKRNCKGEKSNGFPLERSQIRSAPALSRLCPVIAVATLLLTVQGQQVVITDKRRWVDAHWQRGNSYLRIGWNWLLGVLYQGWHLFSTICCLDVLILNLHLPRKSKPKSSWSESSLSSPTVLALEFCQSTRVLDCSEFSSFGKRLVFFKLANCRGISRILIYIYHSR